MTVKALKKQLMAAIAMVVVSAIALSSSTYAWFANNNMVTASGMQISASAEGTMLIIGSNVADLSNKKTTQVFDPTQEGEGLHPVHPIYSAYGSAITAWNHAYSDSHTIAISNSNEVALNFAEADDSDDYYLHTSLVIGLDDSNDSASVGAVTVTGVTLASAGNDLLPSARVLMVVDGNVVGVFGNGTYVSTKGTDQVATPGAVGYAAATADTLTPIAANNTATIASGLNAGDNVTVDLYIYFDGRDASCTSALYNAQDVTVALEFSAADA